MRGVHMQSVLRAAETTKAIERFWDPLLYPSWAIDRCALAVSPIPFRGLQTYCAVCSNSQALLRPLQEISEKAELMGTVGAHLNHYEKFGIDIDHFKECFCEVQQIVDNYTMLSTSMG
jgi:hypothetical protein